MIALAVSNYKGGVGKTTSAVNLAAFFAHTGKRVLLLDTDPQGHVGKSLGFTRDETRNGGVLALYADPTTPLSQVVQSSRPAGHPNADRLATERTRIDVVLSRLELVNYERGLYFDEENGVTRLSAHVDAITGTYDVLLVDCPPNLGVFTLNAMVLIRDMIDAGARGGLVVPTGVSRLDVDGLVELLGVLKRLQADEIAPDIAAIIPTQTNDRTVIARDVLASLHHVFGNRVTTRVRATVRLAEATHEGLTILEYAPDSIAALDYAKVTRDILYSFQASDNVSPRHEQEEKELQRL